MSEGNGNGRRTCGARYCRRVANGHELCAIHAAQEAADPGSIVWKAERSKQPRDDIGLWVTKLEQPLVDGTGATVTVTELVCRALRAGAPMQYAAAYAGIAESTFHKWLKDGRTDEGSLLERRFALEVDKALAECVVAGVARISGSEDWRAQSWMLERRFPREFGQITRTEIANPPGESFRTTHTLDLGSMTLEERVALLAELDREANTVEHEGDVVELDERRAIGP